MQVENVANVEPHLRPFQDDQPNSRLYFRLSTTTRLSATNYLLINAGQSTDQRQIEKAPDCNRTCLKSFPNTWLDMNEVEGWGGGQVQIFKREAQKRPMPFHTQKSYLYTAMTASLRFPMAVLHLYALFTTLVAGLDHARYTSSPPVYPSRKHPFLSLLGPWLIYQLYDWLELVRFI